MTPAALWWFAAVLNLLAAAANAGLWRRNRSWLYAIATACFTLASILYFIIALRAS